MRLATATPAQWLGFTLLLVLGAANPTIVRAGEPCAAPDAFTWVPGQGNACAVPGGWLIALSDGTRVVTHGPDPMPASEDPADGLGATAGVYPPARAPKCISNPSTDFHGELIYARPANQADNYVSYRDRIEYHFYQANGLLRQAAEDHGKVAAFRMWCFLGKPFVFNEVLAAGTDTFQEIVDGLRAEGYTRTTAKHWVWWDGPVANCPGCAGQGTIVFNDSPAASNPNNAGPSYAISYQTFSTRTMLHEAGHNLGAVQLSAPNTSGAGHCNDGRDVMCYDDGGPQSDYSPNICTDLPNHFDCNHDDYFHVAPPAGSYLATHWNVGWSVNRFIQFANEADVPTAATEFVATPGLGEVHLRWHPPENPGAFAVQHYLLYRSPCPVEIQVDANNRVGRSEALIRMVLPGINPVVTHTDNVPAPGVYFYHVSAVNAAGEGRLSMQAVGVALSTVSTPPLPTACTQTNY